MEKVGHRDEHNTGWGWWSETWVVLTLFLSFHWLPSSALADGKLPQLAWQLGRMVEHPNQGQLNQPMFPTTSTTLYYFAEMNTA